MSIIGDLFVKLGFKDAGFNQGIDNAQKKTSAFGSAMGKVGGMIAGAFAVGAILDFGKTSLAEFNKAEQGAMRLLTALGGNSRALDMLAKQSKELQQTTLFEDDETIAAQAAMAMLIKEADKIRELTPLVQDLATAKGIDLASAGFMVAKAVEGSGAALQKMGIQVEGTAGSAERFKSVMDGLNKAVGGQAANAANVGTGSMTQLANAFGNLKEAIGGGIANSTTFKGSINDVKLYVEELTSVMESEHIPKWKKFWLIVSGQSYKGSVKANEMSAADAKWKAELAPKNDKPVEKPKSFTQAEQLAARLKQLQKDISDTTVEMTALDGATPEWKAKADELKGFQEEMDGLTGATKRAEEADKRAADAKAALVDMLIAQRIEEQKILALQGQKITTTDNGILLQELSPKGETTLEVPKTELKGLNTAEIIARQKEAEKNAILAGNDKKLEADKQYFDDLNGLISGGMVNAIESFAGGLAELAAGNIGGKEFGQQILAMVGSFMIQLGMLMITTSTIYKAFVASLASGGWGSLALGVALVAAGSAVSSFAKKGMSGSASGGGSSAASGYGGMQGQSSASTAINGNVVFEVQGNKLVGVLNNQDRRNQNFK
jgi:hypothetical protein